jgi:hypothetical protein
MGKSCLTGRVTNLAVLYETSDSIPGQFEWSLNDSSSADGTVGFTQISSYGHTPAFTINYYRRSDDTLVLTDTSAGNVNGQFQYHNGSTWANGVGSDLAGVRRRYVPSSGLPANTDVYAKLTVT